MISNWVVYSPFRVFLSIESIENKTCEFVKTAIIHDSYFSALLYAAQACLTTVMLFWVKQQVAKMVIFRNESCSVCIYEDFFSQEIMTVKALQIL